MTNKFHVYQSRHVFVDDDHIGKWDVATQTVRLREEFAGMADAVKAYFMRTHGIPMKTLVGAEEFKEAAPLMEFPDHVREAMKPELGDLTPEVVAYARENFPPEEFARRYRGRVSMEAVESPAAPVEEDDKDEEIEDAASLGLPVPERIPDEAPAEVVSTEAPPADPVQAEAPAETPVSEAPPVESPAAPVEEKKPGRKPKPQA